ncbi:hypothetical protein CDAR_501281 [Caerostris darwini]|uniref:Uncharacterized protein n=1 Tax=Caerostris darwini TaxID=1538125 RepID=A0AAV4R3G8_9ARAC|nr:hypothetical protein CDAR_501281 [Caerostris darwini]
MNFSTSKAPVLRSRGFAGLKRETVPSQLHRLRVLQTTLNESLVQRGIWLILTAVYIHCKVTMVPCPFYKLRMQQMAPLGLNLGHLFILTA